MKRIVSLLLVIIMGLSLVACGTKGDPLTDPDLNDPNAVAGTPTPVPADKGVYEIVTKRATDYDLSNISAVDFAKALGVGWNLGNTFDATGGKYDDVYSQEQSWGNPVVTQELIQCVADSGFTVIRIPVTWQTYLDGEYNIKPEWMDRIKEVVDWSLDAGLFVILNTHHEEWVYPDANNYEANKTQLTTIWKQIADTFQDYDERLIFEGLNEPRCRGAKNEWWDNGINAEYVNKLGNDFVEEIRAHEGYNKTRFLMVPAYAASSSTQIWGKYKLPEDNRVIMSIHAYMPYNFALNINGTDKWSEVPGDTKDIDSLFRDVKKYLIDEGRAAVIGECGCMSKGQNIADRTACMSYFAKKAREAGAPFVWWDNGSFTSGETFGLIRRNTNTVLYTDILEAMLNGWYDTDFHFKK